MAKKITCPEDGCERKMDARGLHGHLRFYHGMEGEEASAVNPRSPENRASGGFWRTAGKIAAGAAGMMLLGRLKG